MVSKNIPEENSMDIENFNNSIWPTVEEDISVVFKRISQNISFVNLKV